MAKAKKKTEEEITILVVNDDGITSPGIKALVDVAQKFGRVIVVAPDAPQSGMGHAITIGKPLRIAKVNTFGDHIESFQCNGTPVDCVKLGVGVVLHKKPTICVSGINHGSNASINVIYSGTMSAAMEASLEGVPSVGFSLLDYSWDADFSAAQIIAEQVITQLLAIKNAPNTLWNVNIPNLPISKIKGIKVCKQAKAKWNENFIKRTDPHNKDYYWLTGDFQNFDKGKDTDIYALSKNYASLVPVQADLTDYTAFNISSKKWTLLNEKKQ